MVAAKSLKSSGLQFGAIPFDEKYSKNKEKLLLVTSTQMFFIDGKKRSSESVSKTVTMPLIVKNIFRDGFKTVPTSDFQRRFS
jgi:hypothetical protein